MRPAFVIMIFGLLAACATSTAVRTPVATSGQGLIAAQVVAVDPPSPASAFATATVQFTNASERTITIRGYTIEWDGGQERSDREAVQVPPGSAVRRRLSTRSYDATAVRAGRVIIETATGDRTSVLE